MISHMGNETGCLCGKHPSVVGFSDVISHIGYLSENTSPVVIQRLLRHINPDAGYPNLNMTFGMVRRLFGCNKYCGLSEC